MTKELEKIRPPSDIFSLNCSRHQARGGEGVVPGLIVERRVKSWKLPSPLASFLIVYNQGSWLISSWIPLFSPQQRQGPTRAIVCLRLRLCFSRSVNKLAFWFGHWSYWVAQAELDAGWPLQTSSGVLSYWMVVNVHI